MNNILLFTLRQTTQKCGKSSRILKKRNGYAILELSMIGGVMMRSDITDRMKKNMEIGRIAMLQLRSGMAISDKTARLVAMTVENPDVGRDAIERDDSQDALQAVWVLDDAENMAAGFADLESRLTKLRRLLEKEGYTIVHTEEKKKPFVVVPRKGANTTYELFVVFDHHRILEAQFGIRQPAQAEHSYSLKQLEEKHRELASTIKLVKKLNGLGIKGDEKKIRLAAFSSEERCNVRLARVRRLERQKQRGSV